MGPLQGPAISDFMRLKTIDKSYHFQHIIMKYIVNSYPTTSPTMHLRVSSILSARSMIQLILDHHFPTKPHRGLEDEKYL